MNLYLHFSKLANYGFEKPKAPWRVSIFILYRGESTTNSLNPRTLAHAHNSLEPLFRDGCIPFLQSACFRNCDVRHTKISHRENCIRPRDWDRETLLSISRSTGKTSRTRAARRWRWDGCQKESSWGRGSIKIEGVSKSWDWSREGCGEWRICESGRQE